MHEFHVGNNIAGVKVHESLALWNVVELGGHVTVIWFGEVL